MISRRERAVLIICLLIALMLVGCNAGPGNDHPAVSHTPTRSDQISTEKEAVSSVQQSEMNRADRSNEGKTQPRIIQEKATEPVQFEGISAEKSNEPVSKDVNRDKVIDKDTGSANSRVRLVVTRDFGQSLLSDFWVPVDKPITALELTTSNLKTETAYGGVFITSINGLASGYTGKAAWNKEKEDWFLYYNGKMSPAGANNITVKGGDIIWWDYHNWGGEQKPMPVVPPVK
ncbi:MAG: DUF4430 domain-containing protein [Deltaproteobacteria bacterium]